MITGIITKGDSISRLIKQRRVYKEIWQMKTTPVKKAYKSANSYWNY